MTILIDSNEPKKVKDAFGEYAIDVPLEGFDFKLYTRCGIIAIERKKVPGDFISSVGDGRLYAQILAMRDFSDIQILLLEGKFRYNRDGILLQGRRKSRWNRKGINNLLRSIRWVEGIDIEQSSGLIDTVTTVLQIEEYFNSQDHLSLKRRPGIQTDWIVPTRGERVIHFYQGIPGIAVVGAKKLYDRFPNPIDLYGANVEEIDKIPRFGKQQSQNIWNFLRGL